MVLFPEFAYAHHKPVAEARFKQVIDDFRVEEILGFTPDGEGEHCWLLVEKTGMTTDDVVAHLSSVSGIKRRDISYAGLKDKAGITRQWLSLRTGLHSELDSGILENEKLKILETQRNSRKLRRGSHRGNRFVIVLRACSDHAAELEQRLETIRVHGVPNYFGPQRFGRNGGKVTRALRCMEIDQWPRERFRRGMLLSAARAWLFNHALSMRVAEGSWDQFRDGDYYILDGSDRGFSPAPDDAAIPDRIASSDIHPAGILWGRGVKEDSPLPPGEYCQKLAQGLERVGVDAGWRALRLRVGEPKISDGGEDALVLEFSLGRGAYATTVLRELVNLSNG